MPGCASSARRKKKMESAANRRLFWTTAAAVVAADLVTKLLAESLLARHLPVRVIGDYVQLRSEEHTSELQSQSNLVCRLLLEKKKKTEIAPKDISFHDLKILT